MADGYRLQLQLPNLPHQSLPEKLMRFLVDQLVVCFLIQVPCRVEHIVGP